MLKTKTLDGKFHSRDEGEDVTRALREPSLSRVWSQNVVAIVLRPAASQRHTELTGESGKKHSSEKRAKHLKKELPELSF